MNQPITRNDLVTQGMDVLDKDRAGRLPVSSVAGGVSFATALEVMEFSKLMSISGTAVPKHLRANPGACLAVTFQAVEWRMSPFAVANKSYEVNDRIAYESQLIHAVIESRAPLAERLSLTYAGEGTSRQCTVTGKFTDGTTRDYTSPKIADIKVKNSPLWTSDPEQQLWYYSSRAWCRRWCPDVILGIYSRDELEESPGIGREEEPPRQTLPERLAAANRGEGHDPDKAAAEIDNVQAGAKVEILAPERPARRRFTGKRKKGQAIDPVLQDQTQPQTPANEPTATQSNPAATEQPPEPEKQAQADPAPAQPTAWELEQPPKPPTTGPEYIVYADRWIERETDKENALARWEGEDDMRNNLMVGIRSRLTLKQRINAKFGIED